VTRPQVGPASGADGHPGTSARALVATGAICGLTWAAALRGWMIQMAADGSSFHWYGTFGLVLVPGLLTGALIGPAEHRRRIGGARSRWLIAAPACSSWRSPTRRSSGH
jgi:hypothetical protein